MAQYLLSVHTGADGAPAAEPMTPEQMQQSQSQMQVLEMKATDAIATVTGFPDPDLFPAFGLPMTLDDPASKRS